jgi:thymidylate kinase
MTERETDLLREFKEKLDKLISLHLRMKSEKQLLIEEQSQLNEKIRLLSLNNEELAREMEVLKFAKSMLEEDENSHEAKLKLNRIVREIDKCIALLNK